MLAAGQEVFDVIIIDGPPVLGFADAAIIANAAAASLFIVSAGEQKRSAVAVAAHRLRATRVRLLGTVLTKFDVAREREAGDYGLRPTTNRRVQGLVPGQGV